MQRTERESSKSAPDASRLPRSTKADPPRRFTAVAGTTRTVWQELGSRSMIELNTTAPEDKRKQRRRRYQNGSLQKRKSGKNWAWVAFWWEDGSRRGKTLGKCSEMSKS